MMIYDLISTATIRNGRLLFWGIRKEKLNMNRLKFIEDPSLAGKTCLVTGVSHRTGF